MKSRYPGVPCLKVCSLYVFLNAIRKSKVFGRFVNKTLYVAIVIVRQYKNLYYVLQGGSNNFIYGINFAEYPVKRLIDCLYLITTISNRRAIYNRIPPQHAICFISLRE